MARATPRLNLASTARACLIAFLPLCVEGCRRAPDDSREPGVAGAVLVHTNPCALALAHDATHIYWLQSDRIQRVPKGGGSVDLVTTDSSGIYSFAVDSEHLYWSGPNGLMTTGTRGDGVVRTISSLPVSASTLVVDGPDVYTCACRGSCGLMYSRSVLRVAIDTGALSEFGGCEELALTKDDVVVWDGGLLTFASHDSGVPIPFPSEGIPLGVDTRESIRTDRPRSMASDGSHVFLGMEPGATSAPLILETGRDLVVTTTTLVSAGRALSLAVDAANVYFTDGAVVARMPKHDDGGTILESHAGIVALDVDESAIYWASCGADYRGLIVRTAK